MSALEIRLDKHQKVPYTDQIREKIRSLILAGRLKPGAPLPTVRELAAQLGINFNTAARAYRGLDAEGLIITRQGLGTFVRETALEKIASAVITTDEAHVDVDHAHTIELLLGQFLAACERAEIPPDILRDTLRKRLPAVFEQQPGADRLVAANAHRRQLKKRTMRQVTAHPIPAFRRSGRKRPRAKRNAHPTTFYAKQ